jgi:hypothetical protein
MDKVQKHSNSDHIFNLKRPHLTLEGHLKLNDIPETLQTIFAVFVKNSSQLSNAKFNNSMRRVHG